MTFAPIPFLLNFFAVAMGVHHGQHKEDKPADQHNDDDGLILPDFTDKLRQIGIHKIILHHAGQNRQWAVAGNR